MSQLLDVSTVRCKPQYNMAAEEPLLLYECGFAGGRFKLYDIASNWFIGMVVQCCLVVARYHMQNKWLILSRR